MTASETPTTETAGTNHMPDPAARPTPKDMVDAYLAAELDVLEGKESWWGKRRLTMEDLDEIRKGRKEWEGREAALNAKTPPGGMRVALADMSG